MQSTNRKIVSSLVIILFMFSTYFTGVASAQPPGNTGPPVTIFTLDQNGRLEPAATNVFSIGQEIWAQMPAGRTFPYKLTIVDKTGASIVMQEGNSASSNNLIALSLSPSIFRPDHGYYIQLRSMIETSPGFLTPQTSIAGFSVVRGYAHFDLKHYSVINNVAQVDFSLRDYHNNPSTGVHVKLILNDGDSSFDVTTETTDLLGQSSFKVGQSLAGGNYHYEVKVLDQETIYSNSLELPAFKVDPALTALEGSITSTGAVTGVLTVSGSTRAVEGRLLVLEKQLKDGNWTTLSAAYTDNAGQAHFQASTNSSIPLRITFNGDQFYTRSVAYIRTAVSGSSGESSGSGPVKEPQSVGFTYPMSGAGSRIVPLSPSVTTTTTIILPSAAYATIPLVLTASVTSGGIGLSGKNVVFYNSTSLNYAIGSSTTNSTGYATTVWTPGTYGTKTIVAVFSGDATYIASTGQANLVISQTPTTIQILQPAQITFAWDLYYKQNGNGLPIVVPVNILALARTGNGSSANTYRPTTTGVSTTPTAIPGFGWAGLNVTSSVSLSFNSTFVEYQNMNWTSNFYLPPCGNPPNCSVTNPRAGHMYLVGTLSPPSTLYTGSSTSLNIPFQNVNSLSSASGQIVATSTPPSHIYVKVNASYPYISVSMAGLQVALESYQSYLAYSLQQDPAPTVICNPTCVNSYNLPVLSPTSGTDYGYACLNSSCTSVASNTNLQLYSSSGKLCVTVTTDYFGVATLNVIGSNNCTYPYYSLRTLTTGVIIKGLYAIEAVGNPSPFYTNFQGYNYATYAPQRTGGYLLHMFNYWLNSPYMVLYPSNNYPDVVYAANSCCDVFYTVEKHPTNSSIAITPGTSTVATVVDNLQAKIQASDFANHKGLANIVVTYNITMTSPGTGIVRSGSATTNANGTATPSLGQLGYGNYTFTIAWPGNSTASPINNRATFTIYKAKPILLLRNLAEPTITLIHPSSNGLGSPPSIDGSTQAYCSHNTRQCAAALTTTQKSDIIIVFAVESLNLNGILCTFSVSDAAGLTWHARTGSVNFRSNRDQIQEFWAQSPGILNADSITESIGSACDSGYGGNYNGLMTFGVSGANYNNPFDPNTGVPRSNTGTGGSPSVAISTSNSNDFAFAALLTGGPANPPPQSGFTTIISGAGFTAVSEYQRETSILSNFGVGFGDTAGQQWGLIDDAIQGQIIPSVLPATGSPYRFSAYVGDDRSLQSSDWSCSWPTYHNCVILQADVGVAPASVTRWLLYYWDGGPGSFDSSNVICSFSSCTPTWSTAPSSYCNGAPYCYYFAVDVCCFSSLVGKYVQFRVNAFDISGQSPIFGSYSNGFGYIDNTANGYLIVNNVKVRSSDLVNATSNTETFQFNATQSPNLITSVSLQIINMTTGGSRTICLIGPGCLQPAQTTSQSFLAYPATSLGFSNGAYNLTAYYTCPSCANVQYRIMSVMLQFGRIGEVSSTKNSSIQGATVLLPYYFRTFLADNATQSFVSASGLIEKVYINGVLYTTLTTNSLGNSFFAWTPQASGQYKIEVKFATQNYYPNASSVDSLSVSARGVLLATTSSPQDPAVNSQVTWTVTAYDMFNNSTVPALAIQQYLDGVAMSPVSTDSSGRATFTGSFASIGRHNVTFTSAQTPVYNSAKAYAPIIAYIDTSLSLQSGTIVLGQQNSLTLTLKDANSVLLSGKTVQIKINNVFYQNLTTNSGGQAQFNWRPDNAGTYSIIASFAASGAGNVGYRASSAGLTINVVSQTSTNTQTTSSGSQTVSLTTAQASTQPSIPAPSISITFPDASTISLMIQYNGRSAQAISHVTNIFGWNCYWWGCLPYWNVQINAAVPGVFNFQALGAGLGALTSVVASITAPSSLDLELVGRGLDASIAVAAAGLIAFAAQPEIPVLAGSIVMAGAVTATLAGAFLVHNGNTAPFKSYLYGLMGGPIIAISCLVGGKGCLDLPSVPGFEIGAAIAAWIGYISVGIIATWAIGGWLALIEVALGFLMPALLISLM